MASPVFLVLAGVVVAFLVWVLVTVVKVRGTVLVGGIDKSKGNHIELRELRPDDNGQVWWKKGKEVKPITLDEATPLNPKGLGLKGGISSLFAGHRPLFLVDVRHYYPLRVKDNPGTIYGVARDSVATYAGVEAVSRIKNSGKHWITSMGGLILLGMILLAGLMIYVIYVLRGLVGTVGGA